MENHKKYNKKYVKFLILTLNFFGYYFFSFFFPTCNFCPLLLSNNKVSISNYFGMRVFNAYFPKGLWTKIVT